MHDISPKKDVEDLEASASPPASNDLSVSQYKSSENPGSLGSTNTAPYKHSYSLRSKSTSPCNPISIGSKRLPKIYDDVSGLTERIQQIDINGHQKNEVPSKNIVSDHWLKSRTLDAHQCETTILSIQSKIAMEAVNLHLTQLAEIHKCGWKVEKQLNLNGVYVPIESQHKTHPTNREFKNYSVPEVLQVIDECSMEIYALRKSISSGGLPKSSILDVERAGLALVNHALGLQLYNAALHLLTVSHTNLQSLISENPISIPLAIKPKPATVDPILYDSWVDYSIVLGFDFSNLDQNSTINLETMSLIANSIAQGFQAFLNASSDPPRSLSQQALKSSQPSYLRKCIGMRAQLCIKAMTSPMSLHQWYRFLDHHEPTEVGTRFWLRISAAAQSCYTTVFTACTTFGYLLDPEVLFQLQSSANLSFMDCQTQSGKSSAIDLLMHHARRTLLIYARSLPNQRSDAALHAQTYIMKIIKITKAYERGSCPVRAGWIGLCQSVIHLVRKAGDLNFINDLTSHLKNRYASPQAQLSVNCDGPENKQIEFAWFKLATTAEALDNSNRCQKVVAIPSYSLAGTKTDVKNMEISYISQAINVIEETLDKRTIECAHVWILEETLYTLMNLKFIRCVLVSDTPDSGGEVAALMDFASSITLRRKMLDIVNIKLNLSGLPKRTWPLDSTSALKADFITAGSALPSAEQQYWLKVRYHHMLDAENPADYRPILNMPSNWRVVSLHMSQDSDSLFLVQHHCSTDPLVVKLPITRQKDRKGDFVSFELSHALQELKSIISSINATTQQAKHVSGKTEKETWWEERRVLDWKMQRLIENIENQWLGGFKGFLRSSNIVTKPKALHIALEKIFHGIPVCLKGQTTQSGAFNNHVYNAFTSLPLDCPDEDLIDLISFGRAYHQIQQAVVLRDGVDADQCFSYQQVLLQLREVQKEMLKPCPKEFSSEQHLFLILDRNLQGFPWEVLPHLKGHSISRIPSLSFLRDRLLAIDSDTLYPTFTRTELSKSSQSGVTINTFNTTYILNPSADLISTQAQFESWLESNSSWHGFKNQAPTNDEVRQALTSSELVLYFGHGGGEQYLQLNDIMLLPQCAVTMLWGCSSGTLSDHGRFDTTGTPYAYMLAGCPSLLANLWDVTDKDIDQLAMDLFKRTGIFPSDDHCYNPVSITQALAEARTICKLRYLNGAAPVVYGLPVKFAAVE